MSYRSVLLVALAVCALGQAATLDDVVTIFTHRACSGCHQGRTARESLASFTTEDEHELLKSFAYRHYKMQRRVVKKLGTAALENFRYLKAPAINRSKGAAALFTHNLTRDGDAVSDQEIATLEKWFAEGAPLPREVMDEVFYEIKNYWDIIRRYR